MGKVFAGILVGGLLVAGAAWLWSRATPCLGRCGRGTLCDGDTCVVVAVPTVTIPLKEQRRRARHDSPAASEVHLKPGDDKVIAEGDALGRPTKVDFNEPDARELSQDDLDNVFQRANPRIEKCITESLGDAPLEIGRVEVGLRVEKSGNVSRVRVEAPALLQHNGLLRCIRDAVASLNFPASGAASVVTYPFELK